MNTTIEELQSEIQQLRDLVISLSTTLVQSASLSTTVLRSIELDSPKFRGNDNSIDAEHLLKESEICFRCARIPGLKKEIAERLEEAGNELMAKAVEIETVLQRKKWKK